MSVLSANTQSAPNVFFFATATAPVITSPLNVVNGTSNFTTQIITASNSGTLRVDNYPADASPIGSLNFCNSGGVLSSTLNLGNNPVITATNQGNQIVAVNGLFEVNDRQTGNYITMSNKAIGYNGSNYIQFNTEEGCNATVQILPRVLIDSNYITIGDYAGTNVQLGSNSIIFESSNTAPPTTTTLSYPFSNAGSYGISNILYTPVYSNWTWITNSSAGLTGGFAKYPSTLDPSNAISLPNPSYAWLQYGSLNGYVALDSPIISSFRVGATVTVTFDAAYPVSSVSSAEMTVAFNGTDIYSNAGLTRTFTTYSFTYTSVGADQISFQNTGGQDSYLLIQNLTLSGYAPQSEVSNVVMSFSPNVFTVATALFNTPAIVTSNLDAISGTLAIGSAGTSSNITISNASSISGNGGSLVIGTNTSNTSIYNVANIQGNSSNQLNIGVLASQTNLFNVSNINGQPYPQLATVYTTVPRWSYILSSGTVSVYFTNPVSLPSSNATYFFQLNYYWGVSGGNILSDYNVEWVATMDTGSQAYYVSQRQPSILNVGDFYFNRGTISWVGTTGTSPSITYAQNENFWTTTPGSINMNTSKLTYYRIS